ncbi:MAG TPA: hypothetical protein VGK29_28005 [Paludibaculum sp.]|jgi:hypothetical protein
MRILSSVLAAASLCPALMSPLGAVTSDPRKALGQIPAWFEPAAEGKSFTSRGIRVSVAIDPLGAALSAPGRSMRLSFPGSRPGAALEGVARQEGTTQYLIGKRRETWRSNVAHFERVAARGVYSGVDVIYYNTGRNLEYDLVVAPGANPSAIRLRFAGTAPRSQADGSLRFDSEFVQQAPVSYQERGGQRIAVESRYQVTRNGDVRVMVGRYDRTLPLVIDPTIVFAGYAGGDRQDVVNAAVATPDGSYWIGGSATSPYPYIPENTDPLSKDNKGLKDAFLARITPTENGWRLTHYTFIGGAGDDEITAMTWGYNRVVATGNTTSADLPLGGYSPQQSLAGETDAFVLMYDVTEAGTNTLTYCTYYGGLLKENSQAVAIDAKGQLVIGGYTNSGELPGATSGVSVQPSNRGGLDGFVARFDPSQQPASGLNYASFLGGNSSDLITGVAVDAAGKIYLSGTTMSWDFPIAGAAYQTGLNSFGDLFVTKIDADQTGFNGLLYSSYFGGGDLDSAQASVIDAQGRLWITGYTASTDLPVTSGASQLANAGGIDAFLVRLDLSKSGAAFVSYCTYLGGANTDVAYGLALDPVSGGVTVAGYTLSTDFPVKGITNFEQPPVNQSESFAAKIDPAKSDTASLVWSTTFGGLGMDAATAVTIGADGTSFVAGMTTSANLPVGANPAKASPGGYYSGFFFAVK